MEVSQRELDAERGVRIEQLSSQSEDNRLTSPHPSKSIYSWVLLLFSASVIEDYQQQIEQLQKNLSKKEHEYNSLNKRLNELEGVLQQTIDNHALKSKKYVEHLQSLTYERNALINQESIHSEEQ